MLTSVQYKKIRSLHNKENSIKQISLFTGHSRNTIRKVLKTKTREPFKTPSRASILDKFKEYVLVRIDEGNISSVNIFEELLNKGYDGSLSTLRRYLSNLTQEKSQHSYENNLTLKKQYVSWILNLLQGRISCKELGEDLSKHINLEDIQTLYRHITESPLRYRNRAITDALGCQRKTVRNYIRQFNSGGLVKLFALSRKETKKFEEQKFKDEVFRIFHAPPACYGFNRTSWRMDDLYQTLANEGHALSKTYIRKIIENAGYRYLKAKKVLTSIDPQYFEKLKEITGILSNLKVDEKFFSIDEFGPLAIKMKGGRSWVAPGNSKTFPQWQKSKGSLIVIATLELSTNQVTHFYSTKKNTDEMIKLLEILLTQYNEENRIFFSWDAASWHASQKLYKRVEEINSKEYREKTKSPIVTLAPLPTSAQFLNVIESVFSGMARAIIHNSDYASEHECKAAIDRYFAERNDYFQKNPKRAGNKIWGKERVIATFRESNNCKDPKYR
jgi:transposase